jgi:DNA-binding response OmpR family regulator
LDRNADYRSIVRPAILLVDDDPALGDVFKEHLTAEQFEVVYVRDSMMALAVLETGRKVDLLLVDMVMPEGKPNGVSLALMARRQVQGIKIAFLTGHPQLLPEIGELPGKAFIQPVDLAELKREIRALLGE